MEFHTSRYKLDEAAFFLKNHDVYSKDDEEIEYYLDAYLNTCRSVIDYSLRDFLNSIKQPLKEKDKRWINRLKQNCIKIDFIPNSLMKS